nr:HD domain-containing protein [Leadbettera azotonutricia]
MNILSCLQSGFTEPIRDNLWGHVYLTPALKALTESSPFMRLHRIMQLGPAFRVYPGATHSRAGHSIGVYHLARRLLVCLAEQGADAWLTREGVFSFLCAGLLHDLGHFPYTHSLKELPLEDHEALTAKSIQAEPLRRLVAAAGADPDFTAAIVDTGMEEQGKELHFYRKLLSGVLDPDKLDYLNRDALYCGVPYGAQDVDFIFSRLRPHEERGVDIDSRGIPSVESILFSKYLMYRAVYWHRSVRSATAMIKKALLSCLESGLIAGEELYHLDDQGLFSLMEKRTDGKALFSLAQMVRDGKLYETAAEIPFDPLLHKALGKIQDRSGLEKSLSSALSQGLGRLVSPEKLIIDVPEPISFESGLFVADEGKFFGQSSSAFRPEMVDAFIKSLRVIRVFTDPEILAGIEAPGILQITKKWVQLT